MSGLFPDYKLSDLPSGPPFRFFPAAKTIGESTLYLRIHHLDALILTILMQLEGYAFATNITLRTILGLL